MGESTGKFRESIWASTRDDMQKLLGGMMKEIIWNCIRSQIRGLDYKGSCTELSPGKKSFLICAGKL